jgi:hypothetical protein
MATKLQSFDIQARLILIVETSIKAEDMADAVEQSKTMKETDFVKFERGDSFCDGSIKIIGVRKSDTWDVDQ